jgi:hypothetical protein
MTTEWLECGECGDLFQSKDLLRAPNPWRNAEDGWEILGCPCCSSPWGEPMHQICEYDECEHRATMGTPHPIKRYVWRCWEHRPENTGELS